VEMIATQMAVIHQGRLRIEGSVQELLKQGQTAVLIKTDRPAEAMQFLKKDESYQSAEIHSDGITVRLDQQYIPELNRQLVSAGFNVQALVPQRTLEAYFLNLIGGREG
jgi:ABC-type multidrug transport system ATPase subunit